MTEMLVRCAHKEMRDVVSIIPFSKNENIHSEQQIELLARIMAYQGVRNPITVSTRSGFIVSGHGRLLAAKLNGWKKFPVDLQDFEDEAQEAAARVADNAIQELAELDRSMVDALTLTMPEGFDLELLGIPGLELAEVTFGQGDPDAVPDVPNVAKTKRGELWTLGDHRLLCGDATNAENVKRLMNGEKADMVFTDPPYGVNVKNTLGSVTGDEDLETFKACLPVLKANALEDAHFYVWMAAGDILPPSVQAFVQHIPFQNILPVRCTHENKRGPKGAFKLNYEACLFGNDNTRGFNPSDKFRVSETTLNDDRYGGDGFLKVYPALWDGERATEHNMTIVHPTQKKVEMIEFYVEISSTEGGGVLDLFLGSGSTLIACEKTNRRCYGCEIEPLYCDVILERFAKFSGKDPCRQNADGSVTNWSELKDPKV